MSPCGNPKPIEHIVNGRGCYICSSHSCNNKGYPQITRMIGGKCVTLKIVRYLWIEEYGEIPDGLHTLHDCDDRACINLSHIYLGTNQDNVRDKMVRGRYRGNVGTGKFSNGMIQSIRVFYERFPNCALVGREFGISASTCADIVKRRIYKYVE